MSEKELNRDLIKIFKKLGVLYERIENSVGVGTPDFAYFSNSLNGFIECKYAKKKKSGKVNLQHWTVNQRIWFISRPSKVNFFLLRCEDKDYFLSSETWSYFRDSIGDESNLEDLSILVKIATVVNLKKVKGDELRLLSDLLSGRDSKN